MSIGTSILLLAVGAVLRFAVTVTAKGFDIHTVGLILMIAGAVGIVLSLLWLAVWSDRHRERNIERDIERPEATIHDRERRY